MRDHRLREELLALAGERRTSFCPSEVARRMGGDWRECLPAVRRVAAGLVREGLLICTRRGVEVNPEAPGGPVRLARALGESAGTGRTL